MFDQVFDLPGALDFLKAMGFQDVENGEVLETSRANAFHRWANG